MLKLAIFDIDGTIFRSSLTIELVNGLVEQKIFPKKAIEYAQEDFSKWVNRQGQYENYINKIVESYHRHMRGCNVRDFERAEQIIINKHKNKVYRFTRELIKDLKAKKYYLIAISGSPEGIVAKFAKELGFNAWFGSKFEVIKGKFTGKQINDPFSDGKDLALKLWIKTNKINADLKQSIAIGDSDGDISLLKMVGKPIAFNPSMQLAKVAKANRWKIVVERKDVIYGIKNFTFLDVK